MSTCQFLGTSEQQGKPRTVITCVQSTPRIGLVLWIPAVERHLHMAPFSLRKLSNTSGLTGLCCFAMGIFLFKIVSDYKRQQTVMDGYLQINCFIQIKVTLFDISHAILEDSTKPSPHSTWSCHKQKSFCGTWLAVCPLPLHDAAPRLAEGAHQLKCAFVAVKSQTLNLSN